MITRRQALARLLGGSVALAAADIWIPGERVISLPAHAEISIADLVTVQVGPWIAGAGARALTSRNCQLVFIAPDVFREPQILVGYDSTTEFFTG